MVQDNLEHKVLIQGGLLQISKAVQKMSRSHDLEHVMQTCLSEAIQMGMNICAMAFHRMVDPDQKQIEAFRVGLNGTITKGHFHRGDHITRSWKMKEKIVRSDIEAESELGGFDRLRENWNGLLIRAVVHIPFSEGVISVYSLQPNAFSDLNEAVLVEIAEIFSAGIVRMRELEQVEESKRVLEEKMRLENAYSEIAQTTLSSLNLNGVLDNLGVHLTQAGIFRSLSISLVDHDTHQVEVVCSFRRKKDGTVVKPPQGNVGNIYALDATNPVGQVACTGEMLIIEEYDKRFGDNPPENYAGQAFYFIPAKKEDQVIAVVATGSPLGQKDDTLKKIEAMQPLLDHVVIAIENARLYEYAQQEIMERQQAEDQLEASQKRQQAIVETALDSIITINQRGLIETVNPATEVLFGYREDELIGQNINLLMPEVYQSEHDGYLKNYLTTGEKKVIGTGREVMGKRKDNSTFPISLAVSEVHIDGEQRLFTGILRDLTKEKEREQDLIRLQRLRAISELSAGVSHNLNNMLVGILGPTQFLKMKTDDPDLLSEVDDIFTAAIRAKDLVRRLHQSTQQAGASESEPVDVEALVTEAIHQTRPKWKDEAEVKGIAIEVETRLTGVDHVRATASEMSDIVVNLMFNAVDAMPDGGKITIETALVGEDVVLTFSDTGIGMDEETLKKVFEPFFTTKTDVGTGLGLSTAYNSLMNWGGRIEIESAVGKGTTFYITLPIWVGERTKDQKAEVASARSGKILVVEDDEAVQNILSRLLSQRHEVEVLKDSKDVLVSFKPGQYDVAFIDLGLPTLPGDQLAEHITSLDPYIALVLITGWGLRASDSRRSIFDFMIQKPFDDLDQLYDVIDRAIRLYDARRNFDHRRMLGE